jgi:hypothetical protein
MSNIPLTPEQFQYLQQILGQLSKEDRNKLLTMLHSSAIGPQQFNSDKTKGFQVEVNGGTAYIGDIHIDTSALEDVIREILADRLNSNFSSTHYEDESNHFLDNESEPEYTIESYTNNYDDDGLFSNIGCTPILIGFVALLGIGGVFFSGLGSKTAIITTLNPSGVNVRDDATNIKESLPNGTKVRLTGKRDGDYCQTDHGWIYCEYLTETTPVSPTIENSILPPKKIIPPVKIAIVQPESDKKAANLRIQPNAGKVIGQIPRGQKVQVIRCIDNGCEVSNGSIQGWIYKPYLR